MMYLIKKDGKFTVNASDIETIKKYAGEEARIIFKWDEDKQEESLKSFFSDVKIDYNTLELYVMSQIKKEEILKSVDKFYEEDEDILSVLTDIEVITPREKDELSEISQISKKKQLALVLDSYKKR